MAYYHQSCDSYFVESQEDHERMFREKYRKGEQQRNRDIQRSIADELSQLASEEYREDILKHMEKMEVNIPLHMLANLC